MAVDPNSEEIRLLTAILTIYDLEGSTSTLRISDRTEAEIYTYAVNRGNPLLSRLLLGKRPVFKEFNNPVIHDGMEMDNCLIDDIVYCSRQLINYRNGGFDHSDRPLFRYRIELIRAKGTPASIALLNAYDRTFKEIQAKRSSLCLIL